MRKIIKPTGAQIERAKDILEHVYLAELIEKRKDSKASVTLDDLLNQEWLKE